MRKIAHFDIKETDFHQWMQDIRSQLIFEIVSTAEYIVYNEKKVGDVCKVSVTRNGTKLNIDCKLHIDGILNDMDMLMDYVVEREEYELAHRIKLLNEYIEENGIREKATGRSEKDREWISE